MSSAPEFRPPLPAPLQPGEGWPWVDRDRSQGPSDVWPTVTVVTPSYNQAHFIEETLRSVLLQGYPNLEYIVVDGGSTDGTVEILQHYQDRVTWISEPDRGQADAINKGLRMAGGAILAYLNSDDTYLPGALHTAAGAFQDRPDAGLVFGDCYAVDRHGRRRGLIRGHPFDLERTVKRGEFVPQQAAFWSRPAMEAVGLFDESLHFCMDHDFFIRLGQRFPAHYVARPLANFRFHDTSKSVSAAENHWRESMAVSRRYGLTPLTAWYWIRVARHWGLRLLPQPLATRVRRWLGRAQDPLLHGSESRT